MVARPVLDTVMVNSQVGTPPSPPPVPPNPCPLLKIFHNNMVKDEKITRRMAKEIPINALRNVLNRARKADGFLSGRLASEADYGCFCRSNINNFLEGQAVHEIFVL
jgi:hypothetical protein